MNLLDIFLDPWEKLHRLPGGYVGFWETVGAIWADYYIRAARYTPVIYGIDPDKCEFAPPR